MVRGFNFFVLVGCQPRQTVNAHWLYWTLYINNHVWTRTFSNVKDKYTLRPRGDSPLRYVLYRSMLKLYFVYFMSTVNYIYPWGFKFSAKLKTQKNATALVPGLSQPNPCIQLSAVSAWWPTTRVGSSWLRSSLLICQFNARVWYQICGKSCPTPHKQNNIYTLIMKSLNVTSDTSFIFHTW